MVHGNRTSFVTPMYHWFCSFQGQSTLTGRSLFLCVTSLSLHDTNINFYNVSYWHRGNSPSPLEGGSCTVNLTIDFSYFLRRYSSIPPSRNVRLPFKLLTLMFVSPYQLLTFKPHNLSSLVTRTMWLYSVFLLFHMRTPMTSLRSFLHHLSDEVLNLP